MQDYPHHYVVVAASGAEGNVTLASPGLADLESASPAEFGGPGDQWSPETLLVAAVADCFILSFRSIARASKLDWIALRCDVDGVLERIEKVTRFTAFNMRAVLDVPAATNEARALQLLAKSEHVCLVTNSMTAETRLNAEVRVATTAS